MLATPACVRTVQPLPQATEIDRQAARLDTAGPAIVVAKSQRTLYLYRDGVLAHRYKVVLGRHPTGPKRYEGDMRTPEGIYRIVGKYEHPRWAYFLALDYPNPDDLRRYERDLEARLVPVIEGTVVGVGNEIGIHGNDRPRAQRDGVDWTMGCIAMDNEDVRQLYATVVIGTPVLVLP